MIISRLRPKIQAFLKEARRWEDRVRCTTYSTSVAFSPNPTTGEFTVTAYWQTKSGEKGQYSKLFSVDYLFGASANTPTPRARQVCACMRDFMQEVLHARGV